jgi:hypothetical protein
MSAGRNSPVAENARFTLNAHQTPQPDTSPLWSLNP